MALPTKIFDKYWVYHGDQSDLVDTIDIGKWMLFYTKTKIDSKWRELCDLFDNNKLSGVLLLKCSTSRPTSNNNDSYVIILYCNNSSNKKEILNIGNNLIPYIQDHPKKKIYYKTDTQTRMGVLSVNYTYSLEM